ncbi:hypothetical protein SASPL_124809 [Salvia splendens]|uniref:DUF7138 domain-containing protein n=1 Tax=Salvia splendens TaxID=180675 RepID=A0A8X8XCQ8_SALSN|nr:hypothetical protein SASPL_124809 [Salvia splendens]
MVDDGVFPVAFFDGEREMDIGDVRITPAMDYKSFQLILSEMIGISPNQISIYLVNRRRNRKSPFSDDRRRIPVTGKANFAAICRLKECCFLVILKRSRKSRSRRERMIGGGGADFAARIAQPEPHLVLLRRSQPAPLCDRISQPEGGGGAELQFPRGDLFDPTWLAGDGSGDRGKAFCEECWNAERNGGTTSFHHCINDAVVTQFATRLTISGKRALMSHDLMSAAHGNTVGTSSVRRQASSA